MASQTIRLQSWPQTFKNVHSGVLPHFSDLNGSPFLLLWWEKALWDSNFIIFFPNDPMYAGCVSAICHWYLLHALCGWSGGTVNCSACVCNRFHSLWNKHIALSKCISIWTVHQTENTVCLFCVSQVLQKQQQALHTLSKCCTINTALVSPVSYNHTVSVLCGCVSAVPHAAMHLWMIYCAVF